MSDYNKLGLYDHNIRSYEKVYEQYQKDNVAAIVHATGTGKSFIALQLALDNKNKKTIYVVPYSSITEHEKEIISQNSNVSLEKDFPNLEFMTYQSFIDMSDEEISELEVDLLILDEFHHIGAPVWGQRINKIIETHSDLQIFGMTAYTVRDRGTSYERDMVNPETDELFSNKVVSNYDLCDAMIEEVLPKPNYKSGYVFLEDTCESLENKINSLNHDSNDYKELSSLLRDLKKRIHEAQGVSDIFKTNIKPDGKYIYFCPLNPEQDVNDMESIMSEVRKWIHEMGLTEDDYEFYKTTSKMGLEGKKNRDAFYNDKDLKEKDASNKLRIMFAINQYNEGSHVPGLDGVIMGRSTKSDIVFFEQLGRALSAGRDTIKEYKELMSKTKDELIEECKEKQLTYKEGLSKEELVEILLAPIIIDLSNNILFIKELETNLKDRIKEYTSSKNSEKRNVHLMNASFNIDMINEDLFKIVEYMRDRLTMTWMDKYELARSYYEHHGNLEIPKNFKTLNGYEDLENGTLLGQWITNQRRAYKNGRLTKERIKLLQEIGMIFDVQKEEWNKKYELAKAYYEHYGNLEIPRNFKTLNGYEDLENGILLGEWIANQRRAYNGKNASKLTEERIKLLQEIGMIFDVQKEEWNKKYELAKAYYKHYGNLEIPRNFKTLNGYERNEKGIMLGRWINTQKQAYNGKNASKLTEERLELLQEIGMCFDTQKDKWNKRYELVKAYYEHHGNLEIPGNFKTLNGYECNEKGTSLGEWIKKQRQAYKNGGLTEERLELLQEIGMRFDTRNNSEEWNKKYELARAYYKHYGNLKIPGNFKTLNGYERNEKGIMLGQWINTQRQAYNGKNASRLTEERIELLREIGMRFDTQKDKWNKKYELAKAYYEHHGNLEIPGDFKTLNGYEDDEKGTSLGRWINTQRQAYNGRNTSKLTEERIELLNQIGMKFEVFKEEWNKKYELAKAYYKHYDNLEIPGNFRTLNGYERDERGTSLGEWIKKQRGIYKNGGLTEERIELLQEIGIRFETKKNNEEWNKKYELARAYYEHHGNLEIPQNFKTLNGYECDENGTSLGEWIGSQRQAYKGRRKGKLTEEQIELLNQIGMKWLSENIDIKLQKEQIDEKNINRKKIELYNRFIGYINKYKTNELPSKEEINSQFIEELNNTSKRR